MVRFHIEHPTKGTLQRSSEPDRPRWSWSGLRSDSNVWTTPSLAEAQHVLATIVPPKLRDACFILEWVEETLSYEKRPSSAQVAS